MPVLLFSCDKTVEPEIEIERITGILSFDEYYDSMGSTYWLICTNIYLPDCVVTVNVRFTESLWSEPTWQMYDECIFIDDDSETGMGYEYLITIALKKP